MNTKIELAYALAEFAHEGQKYGEHDYFKYHVLGVANALKRERCNDESIYIVALLHDVMEDSQISLETIYNIFGNVVSTAVFHITNRKNFDYLNDYIPFVCKNQIARIVKIADLEFHLSQPKLKNEHKYKKALQILLEKNNENNH